MKEPDNDNNGIQPEEPGLGTTKPVQSRDEESGVAPMCIPTYTKEIDLEGLIPAQKEMVLKLLTEEADAFAKDDNDVGCLLTLNLT